MNKNKLQSFDKTSGSHFDKHNIELPDTLFSPRLFAGITIISIIPAILLVDTIAHSIQAEIVVQIVFRILAAILVSSLNLLNWIPLLLRSRNESDKHNKI